MQYKLRSFSTPIIDYSQKSKVEKKQILKWFFKNKKSAEIEARRELLKVLKY